MGKAIQHFTKDYEHHESQRRRVKQEVIRTSITAPRIVKFRKGGLLPLIYSNILFPFFSHVTYNETKHISGYDEIIIGVGKERYLKGGFSKSKIQIQESIKIWAQKCAHRTTVTSTIKVFFHLNKFAIIAMGSLLWMNVGHENICFMPGESAINIFRCGVNVYLNFIGIWQKC